MNAEGPLDAQSPSFNITPTLFLGSPQPHLSTTAVASSAEAVAVSTVTGTLAASDCDTPGPQDSCLYRIATSSESVACHCGDQRGQ